MGMSASQARMLSLTSRLSDLEYQAQTISNAKIRLADKTTEASQRYEDSLSKQKISVSTSATTTIDATAYNLSTYNAISTTDKQRFVTDAQDRVLVTSKVGSAYDASQNVGSTSASLKSKYATEEAFLKSSEGPGYSNEAEATTAGYTYDSKLLNYYKNLYSGAEDFLEKLGYTSYADITSDQESEYGVKYDASAVKYYQNVFSQIAQNGYNAPSDSKMSDSDWLYNELNSGNLYIKEWNSTGGTEGSGGWDKVSWISGDSSIQVQSDSSQVAKAEADYDTATAQIKSQDNKYDLQLKQIETEHSAISQEIDSVKKVIDKNIERTFKLFEA